MSARRSRRAPVHAASLSLDFTEEGARIALIDEDGVEIAYVEIAPGSMRSIVARMTAEIEKAKDEEG